MSEYKEIEREGSAFDFLTETLGGSTGEPNPIELDKRIYRARECARWLLDSAWQDQEITLGIIIKKGDKASVVCIAEGRLLGSGENRHFLEPIVSRLT